MYKHTKRNTHASRHSTHVSPVTCPAFAYCKSSLLQTFYYALYIHSTTHITTGAHASPLAYSNSTLPANAQKLACLLRMQTRRQKKLKWAGRLRPCLPHAFSFPLHPPPVSRRVPERARAKGVSHSHSCPTQEDQEYNAREGSLLYAVRRLNTIALLYAVSTL